LKTIVVSAWHEMLTRKLLAIRAIVVCYVASEVLMYSTGALVTRVVPGPSLVLLWSCFGCAAAAGWIVSRTHPRTMLMVAAGFVPAGGAIVFAVYALLPVIDRMSLPVLAFFLALDFVVWPIGILIAADS
jgi:hypothetical protein